ncbi:MAG: hypothetical protein HYV08_13710 [Deltaproteobacteria bacterium]|nr:hypothetical protein [Deltaproteobacteria bacterium]MBI3076283.1 hypothetical protein [Deltaproteobacteria bacterium]
MTPDEIKVFADEEVKGIQAELAALQATPDRKWLHERYTAIGSTLPGKHFAEGKPEIYKNYYLLYSELVFQRHLPEKETLPILGYLFDRMALHEVKAP